MRFSALFLLLFLGLAPALLAQDAAALAALKKHVLKLRNDPALRNAEWAYSLRALDGRQIFALNPDKPLIPASTMKTVTTATALATLKPSSVFTTHIEYTGKIDRAGVLTGDLFIRGSGDPSLGSERFPGVILPYDSLLLDICQKIAASGIKVITGNIVADDRSFSGNVVPEGYQADDVGNYYGASITGLNLHENYFRVFFAPGTRNGDPAQIVRFEPEVPGLNLQNFVTYGSGGDNSLIYGGPYQFERKIVGSIPNVSREFSVKGSVPDPPLWMAQLLKNRLPDVHVTVGGQAMRIHELPVKAQHETRHMLAIYASPIISEIVAKTNIHSINLYAECLLRRVGHERFGEGSTEKGVAAVREYLGKLNMPMENVVIKDGSGLTPSNNLTASFLSQLMARLSQESYYAHFYNSLAIVGETGTCKDMCIGTPARGRVKAKSGTLRGVVCYTGYATGADGTDYAFSIMINRYRGSVRNVRRLCETIMVKMAAL